MTAIGENQPWQTEVIASDLALKTDSTAAPADVRSKLTPRWPAFAVAARRPRLRGLPAVVENVRFDVRILPDIGSDAHFALRTTTFSIFGIPPLTLLNLRVSLFSGNPA